MNPLTFPRISCSRATILTPRSALGLVLLGMIGIRIHEYGHVIPVLIEGGKVYAWFTSVSVVSGNRFAGQLGAALVSVAMVYAGTLLMLASTRYKKLGFEVLFGALPIARMTSRYAPFIPGRDEHSLIQSLGLPDPLAAAIIWSIYVPPLVIAYQCIDAPNRLAWFALLLIGLPLVSGCILGILGDKLLIPAILQSSQSIARIGPQAIVIVGDVVLAGAYLCVRWKRG